MKKCTGETLQGRAANLENDSALGQFACQRQNDRTHYQGILNKDIPVVKLEDNGGIIRVIAGDYSGTKGAANTFTAINLWGYAIEDRA